LVFPGSDSSQTGIGGLVLADWLLDVEVIHICDQFELLLVVGSIHAEIGVLAKLLESLWWLSTRFHVLLHHSGIFLLVEPLVLNIVVEPGTVRLLLQVVVHLVSTGLLLRVVHLAQSSVFFDRFTGQLLVEKGLVGLFFGDHAVLSGEAVDTGHETTVFLLLFTDGVGATEDADGDAIDAFEDF
jgi:hypothetical protein